MPHSGSLLAWIEASGPEEYVAAFIGDGALPADGPRRAPATQVCATSDLAKQWLEAQAAALGLPLTWLERAPGR